MMSSIITRGKCSMMTYINEKNGRLTNIIRKTNIFYNFNYAKREMLEDELIKNTGNEGCTL